MDKALGADLDKTILRIDKEFSSRMADCGLFEDEESKALTEMNQKLRDQQEIFNLNLW